MVSVSDSNPFRMFTEPCSEQSRFWFHLNMCEFIDFKFGTIGSNRLRHLRRSPCWFPRTLSPGPTVRNPVQPGLPAATRLLCNKVVVSTSPTLVSNVVSCGQWWDNYQDSQSTVHCLLNLLSLLSIQFLLLRHHRSFHPWRIDLFLHWISFQILNLNLWTSLHLPITPGIILFKFKI